MIYFGRDEVSKLIKIGFTSREGEDRLRDFQTGCPGQLVLLLQIEGSKQDETSWHQRFAGARERGEWFRPEPELLLEITKAKVLQLEAHNAALQSRLEAESERLHVAQMQLGSLSGSLAGEPMPLGRGIAPPAQVSPLEAENADLKAKLEAYRDSQRSLQIGLRNITQMLEGPAPGAMLTLR